MHCKRIECFCRRNCFKLIITVSLIFYIFSKRYTRSTKSLFKINTVTNLDGQSKLITEKSSKIDKTNYKQFKKNSQQLIPERFQKNLIENRNYPYDHTYDVPDAATYPYKFYFSPDKSYCSGDILLLITVKSAINHFIQRDIIRNTWAQNSKEYEKVQVLFLLGVAKNNPDLMIKVSEESDIFNDILVGSYEDSYKNLTLKTLSGFYWLNFHCSNAKFFMSVDDDVVLNVPSILKYYDDLKEIDTIYCGIQTAWNARVTYRGKWAVPFEKYPNMRYPPYCLGPCYLMRTESAIEIFQVSRKTHCDISVDDAMITGVLRKKVNYKLGSMPKTFCEHLINSKDIESKILKAWKNVLE